MISPIHLRNIPPPPETLNHSEFLELFCKWLKPERYLELGGGGGGGGFRGGHCFRKVVPLCKEAIGVDLIPWSEIPEYLRNVFVPENIKYLSMSTDEYFEQLESGIMFDAVFIDADHSHEQSLKDFMNVKDRVVEDGFIFFHDTYPYDESYIDPHFSDTVYLTALYIKQKFGDEFEQVTLPFNPGFTICKKMSISKQLIYK